MKSIRSIHHAEKINMGGIIIEQALPVKDIEQLDPFLLIHHWKTHYKGGQQQKNLGVGPHPHRGFSPVTLIYKGALHHRDSLGNDSIVKEGGVQWMSAGKGMTHSERPSRELASEGGPFEVIQVWINTPARKKMKAPQYIPLTKEELSSSVVGNGEVTIDVISGNILETEGPISNNDVCVANLYFNNGGEVSLNVPEGFNALLYCLDEGLVIEDGSRLEEKQIVFYRGVTNDIKLRADKETRILFMAGRPIEEEVVTYGPFVMNTTTEVLEAMRDAQTGKMGVLIEEF